MIRKLVKQMLAAQVFSALTVSLCLLIDSIMISRFLHEEGIAAYGLSNPLLLGIGAVGTLLSAGVQVFCSRALGRGSQEEANAGYSSAIAVSLTASAVFVLAVVFFRSFLAKAMGAGSEGILYDYTRDYLLGFSIGAPGSVGALVLVPFLQMAGQSGLLIAAVATMTVTDVALDLLNALVFHGGMFGMGLASALSYYAALLVGGCYFLSSGSVFRFSRKGVTMKRILELFRSGIPAGMNMLSSVLMVFLMNRLLSGLGGSAALAAYTVISSIGNAANCITTGVGGVSLTLSGIFYQEEDRSALRKTAALLSRYSVEMGLGVGVLLLVIAPRLISLFIPEACDAQRMAVLGLRLFAAGLIPCCINNMLKFLYQGTERTGLMVTFTYLEGTVFPVLAAFVFSRFMGTDGAWFWFAAGELLTLLAYAVVIRKATGKTPWQDGAFLLLKKDFGVPPERTLETDIVSLEEVTSAAAEAERFCMEQGEEERISRHIALCIEEMAGNVITYGFGDGKPHHLSVRILNREDCWVLRFRDDCRAFDPVHYVPEGGEDALGIRLVMALAKDARYTYAMNLNNLALFLPKKESSGSAGIGQNA